VEFVAAGMFRIILLLLLLLPIGLVPLVRTAIETRESIHLVLALVVLVGCLSPLLAVWLLLSKGERVTAIYLRAFRSDQKAHKLRSLLKVALGSRFRLSGIRPPTKRVSSWLRPFTQVWMAFRYAGSPHLDLVAEDHNWMARLLASYDQTRLVFIDVRDVTRHVENEIRLSYLAMGAQRCIFITDPRQSRAEWESNIHAILGLTPLEPPILLMLEYPGDEAVDPGLFILSARAILETVPSGPQRVDESAIAFAKSETPKRDWKTRFWETDHGMRWSGIGLSLLFFILLFSVRVVADLTPQAATLHQVVEVIALLIACLTLALLVATAVSYFFAWGRAWKQAGIENRFRRAGDRNARLRPAFSLLCALLSLSVLGLGAYAQAYLKPQSIADKSKQTEPRIPPSPSPSLSASVPTTTSTVMSWHGFSIDVPAHWRKAQAEDDNSLLFAIDEKYGCGFTFHSRKSLPFDRLPPASDLARKLVYAYRSAAPATKLLHDREGNLLGIDSHVFHLRTVTPEGESVLWERVSIYADDVLVIKAIAVGVEDDDPGLLTAFTEASAAVTKQ